MTGEHSSEIKYLLRHRDVCASAEVTDNALRCALAGVVTENWAMVGTNVAKVEAESKDPSILAKVKIYSALNLLHDAKFRMVGRKLVEISFDVVAETVGEVASF
jgi:hypothetical protein